MRPALARFKDIPDSIIMVLNPIFDDLSSLILRVVIDNGDSDCHSWGYVRAKQALQSALKQFLAIVGRDYYV
jgi:hypothetical protein